MQEDTPDRVADRLDYDPQDGAYHLEVDWDSTASVSTTIVLAVSELADREGSVEPLVRHVDPDALDALFEPYDGANRARGTVTFPFGGYRVRITGDGEVSIRPAADASG